MVIAVPAEFVHVQLVPVTVTDPLVFAVPLVIVPEVDQK